ncbi:hypothetical protein L208DRAFT_1339675 [Tricholoma matsutake]|nr:hypothetical protein L208DRAFT_1339671 [Tricholoma matsutake 945]KAF8219492.1 hypothetical protein L208DRAFT_1339675 [Tricholoma matsutake 945]
MSIRANPESYLITQSQLLMATLDNTSNNTSKCETIQAIHEQCKLPICCLGHVVNLANIDIMDHITRIAAIETATMIWEYNPLLPDNRILNGSLDPINLFVMSTDHRYGPITTIQCDGPITTIQCDGHISKHISWLAFMFAEQDWECILEAVDILNPTTFLCQKNLTLWRVLPAIEELQTAWEVKHDNPQFSKY